MSSNITTGTIIRHFKQFQSSESNLSLPVRFLTLSVAVITEHVVWIHSSLERCSRCSSTRRSSWSTRTRSSAIGKQSSLLSPNKLLLMNWMDAFTTLYLNCLASFVRHFLNSDAPRSNLARVVSVLFLS